MIIAALVTGAVVSAIAGSLGNRYLLCFTLGVLAATAFVEARGLFLTTASIPLLFGLITPVAAVVVNSTGNQHSGDSSHGFSTTDLLTLIYPLAQFFPVLATLTIVAAVTAIVRYLVLKNSNSRAERRLQSDRYQTRKLNRDNVETSQRARRATARREQPQDEAAAQPLTVAELLERNRQASVSQRQTQQRATRNADDLSSDSVALREFRNRTAYRRRQPATPRPVQGPRRPMADQSDAYRRADRYEEQRPRRYPQSSRYDQRPTRYDDPRAQQPHEQRRETYRRSERSGFDGRRDDRRVDNRDERSQFQRGTRFQDDRRPRSTRPYWNDDRNLNNEREVRDMRDRRDRRDEWQRPHRHMGDWNQR